MKYISMAIMATVLFFGSGCAKVEQPVKEETEKPKKRGLVAGDKMPILDDFFKPLPADVLECNGRVIAIQIYPHHAWTGDKNDFIGAAVTFKLHKHKKPYETLWFNGWRYIADESNPDIIGEIIKGEMPPDAKCLQDKLHDELESKPWKGKPAPPGLEGVH